MPEGYAATKFRMGDDSTADSDLYVQAATGTSTLHLYQDTDEVIILAQPSSGNTYYDRTVGDHAYDIVKAQDNMDYDGGLTPVETASIESFIWNDENYNGIQDAEEVGIATASVQLTRSYYDEDQGMWILDEDFAPMTAGVPVATETPATARTAAAAPVATGTTAAIPIATGTPTASASNGDYRFENLPVSVVKNGRAYVAGYQLKLCQMPDGYAATKYHAGTDRMKDSDLIAGTLELQQPDEFIILAAGTVENVSAVYQRTVRGIDYDIVKAEDSTGQDGGIVPQDIGASISGIVWDDADGDKQIGANESGIANVRIVLQQYYRKDGKWELLPDGMRTTETGTDGTYCFADMPLSVTIDGKTYLAGYRLWVDPIPDGYHARTYAGADVEQTEIHLTGNILDGCLVLGLPEEKNLTSGTCLDGYNIAKGADAASLDVYLDRDPEETTTAVSETTKETTTSVSATTAETTSTSKSSETAETTSNSGSMSSGSTQLHTTATTSTSHKHTSGTTSTSVSVTASQTKKTTATTMITTSKTTAASKYTTSATKTHITTHTTQTTAAGTSEQATVTTRHTTHTTASHTHQTTHSPITRTTVSTAKMTQDTTHTTHTELTTTASRKTTTNTTSLTTLSSAGPTQPSVTTTITTHTTTTHTSLTSSQMTVSSSISAASTSTTADSRTTMSTKHHISNDTHSITTTKITTKTTTHHTSAEISDTTQETTTTQKHHVIIDTTTTTTTTATVSDNDRHDGSSTQTTTTTIDVSAHTSIKKRIPIPEKQNISGTPKTGENALQITVLIAACGFSLLLVILTRRKKK